MATLIQVRRGTASEWSSANPTLSSGEIGLATDLGQIKIGDGSTAWSSLSYISASDTDDLTEGSTNLYFTNQRALDATQATIASASAAAVAHADALDTDDVAEGSTNLYFTNQRALDATTATIASASAAAVTSANGYTDTSIANLVDTAPSTLDTLNELAAALGDDPSFATTVTNSIATKLSIADASATYLTQVDATSTYAPLSSPALTGTPTAPTASAGTNSTQIATTAYVDTATATVQPTIHPMFIIGGV
jgi:hypothetical protein